MRKNKPQRLGTIAREPWAVGVFLAENPNRAKLRASRSADAATKLARMMLDPTPTHKPLTVSTPLRTDIRGQQVKRHGVPQYSSYEV